MKKVLLVEDELTMQAIVSATIEEICELKVVSTLKDCDSELEKEAYFLLLLDVNLPDGNGYEFCKRLRENPKFKDLQIVFLTSLSDLNSRVHGFELGADDYITKPIEPTEFKVRINARLKRDFNDKKEFSYGDVVVDLGSQKIYRIENNKREELTLTPNEFKLLSHFLQHKDTIISRQDLLTLLWGNTSVSKNTLDTHISSLRKKMGSSNLELRSVFKKGYVLSLK